MFRTAKLAVLGSYNTVDFLLRVRDESVQFSFGSIHRSCQTFKILDFHDPFPRHSNYFLVVGCSSRFSYFTSGFDNFFDFFIISYFSLADYDIF